jgi:tyrosyl-tRNA synthetase
LQQKLAEEVTRFVHSEDDLNRAKEASQILFGKSTLEQLQSLDEDTLLTAMADVPQFDVDYQELENGISAVDLLTNHTSIQPSRSEAKKSLNNGAITINKHKKPAPKDAIYTADLLKNRYLLIQVGKKRYHLLRAV